MLLLTNGVHKLTVHCQFGLDRSGGEGGEEENKTGREKDNKAAQRPNGIQFLSELEKHNSCGYIFKVAVN